MKRKLGIEKESEKNRKGKKRSSKKLVTVVMAAMIVSAVMAVITLPASAQWFGTDVVINEFSSETSPDWIELYNNGTSDVDLNDYRINDSASEMANLSGETVDAKGYLVVDVSDRLSQGSDIITLLNITDGSVIDNVTYGAGNAPDPTATQSAGRYPNGNDTDDGAATANNSNDFRIFDNPTPEAINGILDVPASATVGDKIWINGTGFEATVILSSNQTVTTDATGWYNMTNLPVPTNLTDEQLGDGNMTFSSDVNITEIVFETGGDSLSITADLPSKTKVIEAPLSKFEGVIDTNVSYNLSMKLKSQ